MLHQFIDEAGAVFGIPKRTTRGVLTPTLAVEKWALGKAPDEAQDQMARALIAAHGRFDLMTNKSTLPVLMEELKRIKLIP